MKRIFTHLFVAVLLMLSTTSWAQTTLDARKIYHFQNAHFTGRAITAVEGTNTSVQAAAKNKDDLKQQWYVTKDGEHYIFRNMYNGYYLSQSGQNAWTLTETCTENSNKFDYIVAGGTNNTIRSASVSTNTNGYMHLGREDQTNIQGWGSGSGGTQWTVTNVTYTDEHDAILGRFAESASTDVISTALGAIFSDGACSVLNTTYANMTDVQLYADANYQALPTALRKMVKKVRGGDWSEANADNSKQGWESKYAKKFRLQMYEPYSIAATGAEGITSWLNINWHANNDNPTGVYVHDAGKIYVMVEGEIKDGATLRLIDAGANDRILDPTGKGHALQQGLNVISYDGAGGHLYICYNVRTYNSQGATQKEKFPHKLSEYSPLKIHIEGGAINGFYNACGDFLATTDTDDLWKTITGASVDCDADWEYLETRANLSVVPVLGHRQTLLFSLHTTDEGDEGMAYYLPDKVQVPTEPYNRTKKWSDYGMGCDPSTAKINILMEAWDRVMHTELATLGVVSKPIMEKMNDFYPRWTSTGQRAEIYDYKNESNLDGKTYQEFCQGLDYSEYFNHHGVALGVGGNSYMYGSGDHCGYNHNTMSGIIRDFAVSAGATWGPAHEIGHQHQHPLNLNGLTEVTNNLFSNIALWYKGLSTSRYNGNDGSLEKVLEAFNTPGGDTYTNNIWALTHMYYRLWLYYHLAGNNTQFYPRLFELLRRDPMQKGYEQQGDVSMMHLYKLACEAAGEDLTEFFRAHGYFSVMENRFVGDYSNSIYTLTQEMIDAAIADVKSKKYPENLSILFINDDDENANYVQHDGTTKRDIYGETTPNSDFGSVSDFIAGNATIKAYTATYNNGIITMSGGEGGVGFLILNEKGELVSFSNKLTFALNDEAKLALATGTASVVSVNSDNDVKPVDVTLDLPAVKNELFADLISKSEQIFERVDADYRKVGYFKPIFLAELRSALDLAKTAYENGVGCEMAYGVLYAEYKKVMETAKIAIDTNTAYTITNYSYSTHNMTEGENSQFFVGENATGEAAQWYFVSNSNNGKYYLMNGNGKYCPSVPQGVVKTVVDTQEAAGEYRLQEIEDGVWAICGGESNMHASASQSYNVVGWSIDAQASWWYITAVETNPAIEKEAELQVLVQNAEAIVNEVASSVVWKNSKLALQADDANAPMYITSNATEAGHEPKYLLDNSTGTYFHTVWAANSPGADHYLQIDMGEEETIDQFLFGYTNLPSSSWNVDAAESIIVQGAVTLDQFTEIAELTTQGENPLPTAKDATYTSATLGTKGTGYRYIRFTVTDATGGTLDNHHYFGMSEFSLLRARSIVDVNDVYSNISEELVASVADKIVDAKIALESGVGVDDVKDALEQLYNSLYEAYNTPFAAKKTELQKLIAETNELIATVGTVEFGNVENMKLTSGNFYCNAPYPSDGGGTNGNLYNLADGVSSTYLHTNPDNTSGDGYAYHYLRVDLGEGNSTECFKFSYQNRIPSSYKVFPNVMDIQGSIDGEEYESVVEISSGLPENAGEVYNSPVLGNGNAYRYFRFVVKSTYENRSTPNYFCMCEFSFSTVKDNISVNDEFAERVSEELLLSTYFAKKESDMICGLQGNIVTVSMLDTQIAALQAAKDALEEAMAKVTVDKTDLQSLYDLAVALYGEMADENGAIKDDYTPSALTTEMLATAKAALDAAKDKLDNSNSQTEIDDAEGALQAAYDELLVIENANVATTIDKSGLNTAIANADELITEINANLGYYATATGLALEALNNALQNARIVATRYYLTETQYNTTLTTLNTCLSATQMVVNADCTDRAGLTALIGNVNTLLSTIAEEREVTIALPLQATTAGEAYYIWCNDPAGDSNGVAGLIDKNADGTANTGTFLGTNWGSDVPAYTHYIEVDLGATVTLDQLTMDYTTRNSTHADQRPNAIKILGSNDKVNYTEITEITSGLAADANEQWSMAESLDLCGHYRYIRVAVGSQRGFFHMSDFNLYTTLSHTLKEYYTTAEGLDLMALCLALDEAQDAAACYMTTEQYTAVYGKLNGCYTTANAIVVTDYNNDRSELETLAATVETLVGRVVAVNETETKIALQYEDENAPYYIYCNAPGATNNYAGDNLGVEALLDVDDNGEPITATFLHTTYTGNSHDDNLDHYLRVDMGESNLLSFKFRYTPRTGNTNNAPLVMLIEGSNDCVNFEEITTLTEMATTYQSDEITNGKAYRYIRFMVKDTHNHGAYNGHKFFAMSHFEMTACKRVTISDEYASPNLSVDVAANAHNELVDATALDVEHYLPNEVGVAAQEELQAAYDALNAAIALQNIPVKLTTDVNNPVLYKIRINRSYADYASLQFDASDSKVAVAAMTFATADAQSWFFMQGTDGSSYEDILILPYVGGETLNTTKRLAAENADNGAGKVMAVEADDATYTKQNWYITVDAGNTAEGWWNIRPEGDNYFSNHSGNGNKMGFWNSSSDDGSEFKFILDEAYAIVEEAFASYDREPYYANVPGYLASDEYNNAYDAVAGYVENKNGEDAEVFAAFNTLKTAKASATQYVHSHDLEDGGVYRIMNLITNTETQCKYHYIANSSATIAFPKKPADDGSDLWVCIKDGETYKFVSALGTLSLGWKQGSEDAQAYTVAEGKVEGAKRLKNGNTAMALTNEKWGTLGFNQAGSDGNTQSPNWSTDWFFQKVEDATVAFNVNISSRRFSSLYLPYSVTVPEGVSAFTAVAVDGGYVDLYRVADNDDETAAGCIIPARTPVILYIEDDNKVPASSKAFTFEYTTEDASLSQAIQEQISEAIICGKILQTAVECTRGYRYYKLGSKNGDLVSKMYWMWEEYSEDGTIANGNAGTDNGGYIRCSANKIYMQVPESNVQNAFSMRFASETTGAEDVKGEDGNVKTIYDLQGRKLNEITHPGFYMINGKKVYVK